MADAFGMCMLRAELLTMRIAFDLDGTLIPRFPGEFPVEPQSVWGRFLGAERLRAGTRLLCRRLVDVGHDLAIYTSSLRPRWHIRRSFACHGIGLKQIVTAQDHDHVAAGRSNVSSKHPSWFGFDVLIDDSPGVLLEANQHGFKCIHVLPGDLAWSDHVLQQIKLLSSGSA